MPGPGGLIPLKRELLSEGSLSAAQPLCPLRPSVRAGKALLSDSSHLLTGEDPDVGEDRGPEDKGTTEDEMAGWHRRLNGPELAQTPEMLRDREAWRAAIHRLAKSRTQLSD